MPNVADNMKYAKKKSAGRRKQKVEYYDDEELDRFRGHSSDGYSEEEIEEFREVMYTCKEDEVAGWSRSLQLRGIELPNELKDELFLIVGERRFK